MFGFILIAIILLTIAVYTVFLLLSVFFSANKLVRRFILVFLITISAGFLLTSVLMRLFNNLNIRLFYIILALGIGLLFYLTISAILFQITNLISLPISRNFLAKIGVVIAIILFIIGIFNASFPQVKNISVTLANLPVNWQGKKIVQISDLHLGGIYGPGFLNKQVNKINALKPDLIVITGDLFDGTLNNLSEFSSSLAKLKAKEGIFFVPGNHDTYLGLDKVALILKETNIITLRDEAINLNGLEIIGFDYGKFAGNDTSRIIKNLNQTSGLSRILLNHTPTDILLAKQLLINLQLSGHSHRGQMFPLSLMTRVLYGKYQYGFYNEGEYNIYTSSGLGSWGPPIRTFNPAEIVSIIIN